MTRIYQDENRKFQFDFSAALWATDRLHDIYAQNKVGILSDVDFIAETEDSILLIEYKNADIAGAVHPEVFNPFDQKRENRTKKVTSIYHQMLISIMTAGCTSPPCRKASR